MSSNASWGKQFANSDNTSAWKRTAVNTPQTNPASWPQLGASDSEQPDKPQPQVKTQDIPNRPSEMSNPTSKSESDPSTTSAWGRLPDTEPRATKSPVVSGWGSTTSSSWGHNPPSSVDDGTSVWGKSTTTQQHQGKWGGPPHISQANEPPSAATGWGVPEPTPQSSNQEANSTASNQPASMPSSQTSGNQPVTWAKAAAAGLPPSSSASTEIQSTGNEQETVEVPVPPAAVPETDPIRKLVNSHEGWGKKPVQQGTSWNISNSNQGISRPQNNVSNGTEVWGKPSGGQMPPGPGWSDSSSKQSGGWSANQSNTPAQSGSNWGAPQPQQQQQSFPPANPGSGSGWGNSQQQSGINNNRWNDMPCQPPTNSSGWNGPPAPQPVPGNSNWGNMPSNNENSSSGWGSGPPPRPVSQGAGWGNNMMPQSNDQGNWGRSTDARRPNTVNDGTAGWGETNTFPNLDMWDKGKGLGNSENMGGQMPNMNSPLEPKGWGAPPNQAPNRAPSPSNGWSNVSPTRANNPFVDNGTSLWGSKNVSSEKWDKGNGAGNWNNVKQNPGSWNQSSDQQWGSAEGGSNWGSQISKNENMMKNNMDFGPRGNLPPQQNVNQQMMRNNQMPPFFPPQLQNQFHQIRLAVMNGLLPNQILSPQMMTPQHVNTIMQFINKTTELQKIQMKLNMLSQNKALPQLQRHQQIEQLARAMRQCQQQIEGQKALIMQNLHQSNANKPQQNISHKMNGPAGGMELGGVRSGPGGQSMMSPLNNMNAMSQALPSPMSSINPNSSREQKSRFINNFIGKQGPNNFGIMGDNSPQSNQPNMGFGMGPGGDATFKTMPYMSNPDDLSDIGGMPSTMGMHGNASSSQPFASNDQAAVGLADIGPPEFTPGVPWKGFRHIDPESDPNITPGSVASAKTMSINTVRDADQVLSRDRSAQGNASITGSVNDGNYTVQSQDGNRVLESNTTQIWSTGVNSTTAPTNAASNTPAGFALQKDSSSWGDQQAPGGSWEQQNQRMQRGPQTANNWNAGNQDNRGSWLVLTNLNQQVDSDVVQNMCAQHGTVLSFQFPHPMDGMAVVKFRSPDEAANAKKALNMCMFGSTILVAIVATDHEVSNFMTATNGGGSLSPNATANRSMSGSTGGFMGQPPPPRPNMVGTGDMGTMPSSGAGQQFWGNSMPNNFPPGTSWANNAASNPTWSGATGEEVSRIMSPMHSLLPENLLGGEAM